MTVSPITLYKSSQYCSVNMTRHSVYFSNLHKSTDLNPIEHLWDVLEKEINSINVQLTNLLQLCDADMPALSRNIKDSF